MKTRHCRIASVPLAVVFAMALALPLATLARPAHTRPTAPSRADSKIAKDPATTDVALPAPRSCQPTDDSEYTDDVAGGPVTEDASTGIQVGRGEPGEAEAAFKAENMLVMSPEEEAAYDAAVAAYETYNRDAGRCVEGDEDASAGD
jgi:hypothetical protein